MLEPAPLLRADSKCTGEWQHRCEYALCLNSGCFRPCLLLLETDTELSNSLSVQPPTFSFFSSFLREGTGAGGGGVETTRINLSLFLMCDLMVSVGESARGRGGNLTHTRQTPHTDGDKH